MIILYVFLGILGLLLFLLLIPVIISIKFREELELEVKLLFFYKQKLDLTIPEKDAEKKAKPTIKPKKKKSKDKSINEKSEPEKKKPEIKLAEIIDMISKALEAVNKYIGELLGRFLIYDVKLYMAITADDAAEVAIKTGQYNAWIYGFYGLLCNFFRTKNITIQITPDYIGKDTQIDLDAKIRFIPLLLLATLLKLAIELLVIFIKNILNKPKERKGGAKNEQSN